MAQIHYLIGDATEPVGHGPKIIAHVCNDYGGWGVGFVLALSRKWPYPEDSYRKWSQYGAVFALGEVQFVPVEDAPKITVANMVAQRGFKTLHNDTPLDYRALAECLVEVGEYAAELGASVHMTRIGCGLGGGEWTKVEEIVSETLVELHGVDVFVYDLPTKDTIEDHHLMDEGDVKFQQGLHDLAKRSGS